MHLRRIPTANGSGYATMDFGDDEAKVACGQLGLPASGATTMDLPDDWLAIPDNLTGFKADTIAYCRSHNLLFKCSGSAR